MISERKIFSLAALKNADKNIKASTGTMANGLIREIAAKISLMLTNLNQIRINATPIIVFARIFNKLRVDNILFNNIHYYHMFTTLKSRIILGAYILVLISIPVGSYLISQQQTLTSKASQPKKTKIVIVSPAPSVSPKSSPKPSPSLEATSTVSFGPTLSGSIKIEGRPEGNQSSKLFLGILENLVNNPTFLLSFTVDLPSSGEFANLSLAGLLSGRNYYAVLKGEAQIATSSAFTISPTVTRLNSNQPLNLLSGDLNEDNAVTAADYDLTKASLGANKNSPKWNELADLNSDGIVNLLDLGLISKNLGKVGATGVWVSPQPKTATPSGSISPRGQQGYWIFVPNL